MERRDSVKFIAEDQIVANLLSENFNMSQASHTPSAVSRNSELQNAPADVEDTASSVVPYGADVLPGMSGYAGASASTIAPNTAYRMRRAQSPIETSAGMRRARSVSPVGLTIA